MSAAGSSSHTEEAQANQSNLDNAQAGLAAAAEELISAKVKLEQECLRLEAKNARLIERNLRLTMQWRHLKSRIAQFALNNKCLQVQVHRLRKENKKQAIAIHQMMACLSSAGLSPPTSSSSQDRPSDKGYGIDPGADADEEDNGEDNGDESGSDWPVGSSNGSSYERQPVLHLRGG